MSYNFLGREAPIFYLFLRRCQIPCEHCKFFAITNLRLIAANVRLKAAFIISTRPAGSNNAR
jgi:hypothetical protein